MNNIGWLYRNGLGVPQDYAEAMRWYRKAADAGDSSAMTNIGGLYENGWACRQDYAEAMRWYRKAADAGNSSAMNNIGWLYQNGLGVPQDYAEAMRWYRKAADAGNSSAMNNIGRLYQNGWGVPQDYAEAMRWYRQAADAGNSWAMTNIGLAVPERLGRAAGLRGGDAVVSPRPPTRANSDAMYNIGDVRPIAVGACRRTTRRRCGGFEAADAGDSAAKDNLDRLNNLIAQQSKTASSNSGCLIVIVSGSLFASGLTAWWVVLAGILPWLN
jgi:TPR repeat protein